MPADQHAVDAACREERGRPHPLLPAPPARLPVSHGASPHADAVDLHGFHPGRPTALENRSNDWG